MLLAGHPDSKRGDRFVNLSRNRYGRQACVVLAVGMLPSLWSCVGHLERPRVPDVIVVPPPGRQAGGNYTLAQYDTDLTAYGAANGDDAVKLRNRMTHSLLAEIDYAYYDYETKLFLNEGRFHIGSDFLQLGLAAGSTVTNGARAKTVLSALLSGVTGTSLSLDKNLFSQQTVQAIMSSMEANRDRIKTVILQELSKDTTAYPFQAARADLIKYFFAGTLPGGLLQLHQQAATNAQAEQSNLNTVQVTNISAADVASTTQVNQAVAKAFQSGNLTKIVAFLKAMGAVTEDNPPKEKVEAALRDLGRKIATDPGLRSKYFDEARKAGVIQ